MRDGRDPGSFRDPDGFVYRRDGVVLRQLHAGCRDDWTQLHASGLAEALQSRGWLLPHEERPLTEAFDARAWRVIAPTPVPWISYPYEWSPAQLRAAGQLTLDVLDLALQHGMTLKDGSAFNVQFFGSRPVFVDTLSLTRRPEGAPWAGYRQFCQHFVGPLALMDRVDPRLRDLSRSALDGPALDLVSRLLPRRTWLHHALLTHVHLHARSIARQGDRAVSPRLAARGVSLDGARALVGHLRSALGGAGPAAHRTEWADYEETHNYSAASLAAKERIVADVAEAHRPARALDLGANTGRFSAILAGHGAYVIALDADVGAVERCFARERAAGGTQVLPLWGDLAHPSPAQGWGHEERAALAGRGPVDLVLALALVHHLAIQHNVPLPAILDFLTRLGRRVIVEWVPKGDPQAQRLLVTRPDVFADYREEAWEEAVTARFTVEGHHRISGTERVLYILRSA